MAAADLTSLDAVIKKLYDDKKVADLTFKKSKLFGMVPKRTDFVGKSYEVPVTLANIAGGSADFADAVANRAGTQHERWSLTRKKNYQTATIDQETMLAMVSDKGAFLRAVTSQLDSAFNAFAADTSWALYADGTGVRGTVTGVPVGNVITLASSYEARAFEIGMTIEAFTDTTFGTSHGTAVVTEINRAAPSITVDAIGSIVNTDVLVREGDHGAKISGLGAWLEDPSTVTATAFYGVDRTQYLERLAGLRYDNGSSEAYDVTLRKAGAEIVANDGAPSACFVAPTDLAIIDTALDGDREFDKVRSQDGHVGYNAIKVHLGGEIVPVLADTWCPPGFAYLLDLSSMVLASAGAYPQFIGDDGAKLHRLEGSDASEFRIGGYGNLCVARPGHNCVAVFQP